jgi:hypothetical protein
MARYPIRAAEPASPICSRADSEIGVRASSSQPRWDHQSSQGGEFHRIGAADHDEKGQCQQRAQTCLGGLHPHEAPALGFRVGKTVCLNRH